MSLLMSLTVSLTVSVSLSLSASGVIQKALNGLVTWQHVIRLGKQFPDPPPRGMNTPTNTIHWYNAGWMLGMRRRRWINIKPALGLGAENNCLHQARQIFPWCIIFSACFQKDKKSFKHIRANTALGQNSFLYKTIPDWNHLPPAAIESRPKAAYKRQFSDPFVWYSIEEDCEVYILKLTFTTWGSTLDVRFWRLKSIPHCKRKIFIMAVDPWHRYSNESEISE